MHAGGGRLKYKLGALCTWAKPLLDKGKSGYESPHVFISARNVYRLGDCVPVGPEVQNAGSKNTWGNRLAFGQVDFDV